jgi:Transposase DDE domain/Transposase domain (DUF772)
MERWNPPVKTSAQERLLLKRLTRVRALFGFLRLHRHEIFDEEFQERLETVYRDTGAGAPPHPPALLCMVVLLQGYVGASDAEAVELAVVDLRWQMVLDCIGCETPPFSQGALQAFRERMVGRDLDQLLLERTARLVRAGAATQAQQKSVSKALRVAIDSRPLAGAGRVEDTINLLGHAARSIVRLVSNLTELEPEEVCKKAGIPILLAPSIKAGLDIDWSDAKQKAMAIETVERQVSSLERWVERHLDDVIHRPLQPYLETLVQVREQDLETTEKGTVRIRQGVARDRRISVEDAEMRHGRKSKSKRFDGYKEHIARDLDSPAIVACAVTPANQPEEEAAAPLGEDIKRQKLRIKELHIDRAYVNSLLADEVAEQGGQVLAKPWGQPAREAALFTKREFKLDLRRETITCPAGQVEHIELGTTVQFDPEVCGCCGLRAQCTQAASGRGRTVCVAADEVRQKKFRRLQHTKPGRATLRQRVGVEHSLAHIAARKGSRARYIGVRKNLFDLRRAATIQNLEGLQRISRQAA